MDIQNAPKGSLVSGLGGALLTLMFFSPWVTACNTTISGKNLALDIESYGVGESNITWLLLLLLIGLGVAVIGALNFNADPSTVHNRSVITIGASVVALGMLLMIYRGIQNANADPFINITIESGFRMSVLGAVAMLAGGLWDRGVFKNVDVSQLGDQVKGIDVDKIKQKIPKPKDLGGLAAGAAAMPSKRTTAALRAIEGNLQGATYGISHDNWVIGRSQEADIQLSASEISRKHAVIRKSGNDYFLQDQGSLISTHVNGQEVVACKLQDGDLIEIAGNLFEFKILS